MSRLISETERVVVLRLDFIRYEEFHFIIRYKGISVDELLSGFDTELKEETIDYNGIWLPNYLLFLSLYPDSNTSKSMWLSGHVGLGYLDNQDDPDKSTFYYVAQI